MDRQDGLSAAKRALLEQRMRGGSAPLAPTTIPRRAADAPRVTSPGQERLWFLHQLEPASSAYNMAQAVRITGRLDVGALRRSVEEVVRRHEVLRTTYEDRDGRPHAVVAAEPYQVLKEIDLASLPEPDRRARVEALTMEAARSPFPLDAGPLLRMTLLRLAPEDHVLTITMHHIVSDEWSLEVFWRELGTLYTAAASGALVALPDLPIQYSDYAGWQRARQHTGDVQRQIAYWREKLQGDLPRLQLPTDPPDPLRLTERGGLESISLPTSLAEALTRLSARQGATGFMTLLAAFVTLLHRYTGETDLVVGAPVTNRNHSALEGLIGFFINTLVLRTDLSGDPSFTEALRRVWTTVVEGLAHQDAPFEALVNELTPARLPGRNPLFDVMFVLQKAPHFGGFPSDLHVRPYPVSLGASKFDLTLFATEFPEGLQLTFEYRTSLFSAATARRMLRHLQVLLEGVVDNPELRLSELPVLPEEERRRVLVEWNTTPPIELAYPSVHRWFEDQARRTPNAIAVWSDDRKLDYRTLNEAANGLADRLRHLGVGADVCVGLCAERSPELLIGVLAILKAGGAYVPLDPGYPEARNRFALDDTRAPVLLAQRRSAGRLESAGAVVVWLDEGERPHPLAHDPDSSTTPEHLAYVIYTSGSTGRPKGVRVTHRNLLHSTRAREEYYRAGPERFLLLPSFAFDSSVAGIFWTLCTGGALVLPRHRAEQDVSALADLIAARHATHLLCLPSLYELILEHAEPARLASLGTVIVAGEACPPALARRHHERLPHAGLFNEYGPTEATVWSTAYRVPASFAGDRVPIGRPIAGTRVYVLDAQGQPGPIGVPGELYIGGPGVSGGYLNRLEESARRFVPDPFSGEPGARLYRTGDRVRWRSDGELEFLGRTDRQIKIRGYRIEPGEIEAALRRHPDVAECVIATRAETQATAPPASAAPGSGPEALLRALLSLDPREAERALARVEGYGSHEVPA